MFNSTYVHDIPTAAGHLFYDNSTMKEPQNQQDDFVRSESESLLQPYVYDGDGTIFLSRCGQIIPTISGSLSIVSSSLIIYIILRSQSKFKSPYHIIMFCLSVSDIIASTAMAFATVPMPKDVIYPFEGAIFGNTRTCELQGFAYMLGVSLVLCSNISLNIFYLCTIRYGMSEARVKKILLPLLFVCSLAGSLPLPILVQLNQMFNPSPHESFCAVYAYPGECFDPENDHIECIRGARGYSEDIQTVGTICIGSSLAILLLSMVLIIRAVYLVERYSSRRRRDTLRNGSSSSLSSYSTAIELTSTRRDRSPRNEPPVVSWESLELTKMILIQAIFYVVAFLLSWLPTLIVTIVPLSDVGDIVRLIFQPLQGFFSAIIFVYHKAHNLYRSDDVTMWQAVWKVIVKPSQAPEVMIERLSMVLEDHFEESRRMPIETFRGTRIVQSEGEPDASTPAQDDGEYVMKTSSSGNANEDADKHRNDRFPIRFDDLFASSPNFYKSSRNENLELDEELDIFVDARESEESAEDNEKNTYRGNNDLDISGDPSTGANLSNISPPTFPSAVEPDDISSADKKPAASADDTSSVDKKPAASAGVPKGTTQGTYKRQSSDNSAWSMEMNRRSSLDFKRAGLNVNARKLDISMSASAATVVHRNSHSKEQCKLQYT